MKENVTPEKKLRIYTSRYSNPMLKGDGYYTVGVSKGSPRWKLGYTVNERKTRFAPSKDIWDLPEEEFSEAYMWNLDEKKEKAVSAINDMIDAAGDKDIVLLCFEDIRIEGQFCHRTALGKWITKELGIEVEELPDPTVPKGAKKSVEKQEMLAVS